MKLFILDNYAQVVADVKHADASGVVLGPAAVVVMWPRPNANHEVTVKGCNPTWESGRQFDVEPDGGVLNAAHVVRSLELTDEAAESWRKAILAGLAKLA